MSEYFWWAVTSPLWIGPAIVIVVGVVAVVAGGIVLVVEYIKEKVRK